MTTAEIVDELKNLTVNNSEDYATLDRLDELTTLVQQHHDGYLTSKALLGVLERHPQVAFGAPGQLVHTIETYSGHYEKLLLASPAWRPTYTTVWMLKRLINAATGAEKNRQRPPPAAGLC